ncbi:uncharacterized protein LOC131215989 [Anopheles bellator]|uniref:uncharacterized protein LOC131215989 n=1 Tax=Anopheles bellator TaxID=139047 RepID=UPI0026489047|nr:uncharacterized protein LOC131215989 [Anopheles bellator]
MFGITYCLFVYILPQIAPFLVVVAITTVVHSAPHVVRTVESANGPAPSVPVQKIAPSPTTTPAQHTIENDEPQTRAKRAIIFRPLFVYRQQEIKRQKAKEMREQQQRPQTTQKPHTVQYYAQRYPYQCC